MPKRSRQQCRVSLPLTGQRMDGCVGKRACSFDQASLEKCGSKMVVEIEWMNK